MRMIREIAQEIRCKCGPTLAGDLIAFAGLIVALAAFALLLVGYGG